MTTCVTATPGVDVITKTMAPGADPFVGPDHAALEAMLAGMVDVPA